MNALETEKRIKKFKEEGRPEPQSSRLKNSMLPFELDGKLLTFIQWLFESLPFFRNRNLANSDVVGLKGTKYTRANSEQYSIEDRKLQSAPKLERSTVSDLFKIAPEEPLEEEDGLLFMPNSIPKLPPRLVELKSDVSIDDFKFVKYLGRGAFGTVDLYKCKLNNQPYAIKQLSKAEVSRQNRVKHLLREKDIMNKCKHPNIVRLEATFKDDESCYFCLEYHPMGDLASLLKRKKKLSTKLTRFYAMEIIKVLSYFRKHNIVHRDLKPENILIDGNFH